MSNKLIHAFSCSRLVLAFLSVGCSSLEQGGFQPPIAGNSVLVISDVDGNLEGRTGLQVAQGGGDDTTDMIAIAAINGGVGFGRGYTQGEWTRLMAGERITHSQPDSEIGTGYVDRNGDALNRGGNWEQMERVGSTFVWTIEWGPARDSYAQTVPGADQLATMQLTFTPEFTCHICMPSFPDTCIGDVDAMYSTDFCRNVIEDFDLVEHGFVDPAVLEM